MIVTLRVIALLLRALPLKINSFLAELDFKCQVTTLSKKGGAAQEKINSLEVSGTGGLISSNLRPVKSGSELPTPHPRYTISSKEAVLPARANAQRCG